jgi:hypothetical protein
LLCLFGMLLFALYCLACAGFPKSSLHCKEQRQVGHHVP